MGSLLSSRRFKMNGDHQDDDIDVTNVHSWGAMINICGDHLSVLPPLLNRYFFQVPLDQANGCGSSPCVAATIASKGQVLGPVSIRVLQWNILSQTIGQRADNFVAAPVGTMDWPVRRWRILQEILVHKPDVICLQEVDHFLFLKKTLGAIGYDGNFTPKPDSLCLKIEDNNGPDGCAIFYDSNKFDMLRLASHVIEVWKVRTNQVVMLMVLRFKELPNRKFSVATTHLKARHGPLLSKFRNEQGKDLLRFIQSECGDVPLILTGDFNAQPDEPVYETLLSNRLGLNSAYVAMSNNKRKEPPYTTWKIREDGETSYTLDYIFYREDRFNVRSLLDFPSGVAMGPCRVPSLQYPSDHFSLVADLEFVT